MTRIREAGMLRCTGTEVHHGRDYSNITRSHPLLPPHASTLDTPSLLLMYYCTPVRTVNQKATSQQEVIFCAKLINTLTCTCLSQSQTRELVVISLVSSRLMFRHTNCSWWSMNKQVWIFLASPDIINIRNWLFPNLIKYIQNQPLKAGKN